MYFRLIFLLLQFVIVTFSYSEISFQKTDIRFEHFTIEDGLDHNTVLAIVQDSSNFIWFGTRAGLNRFDGEFFRNYAHNALDSSSLGGYYITSLCVDKKGNIWIGTKGNGVSRFSPTYENFTNFRNDPSDPTSLHNDHIGSVFCDSSGNIWIGTSAGFSKFISDESGFLRIPFRNTSKYIENESVKTLIEPIPGEIWGGTDAGNIYRISIDENMVERIRTPLRRGIFYKLLKDKDKNVIWLGSLPYGLYKYDMDTETWENLGLKEIHPYRAKINGIYDLVQDSKGHLWIGSVEGISKFDPENNLFQVYFKDKTDLTDISDEIIQKVYLDKQGILWLGTNSKGIYKHDPSLNRFELIDINSGLLSQNIFDVQQGDSNSIWISTIGGGLSRISKNGNDIKHYTSDDSDPNSWSRNYLSKILPDTGNKIWMTSWDCGIYYFDTKNESFKHYKAGRYNERNIISNSSNSIYRTRDGTIWIGPAISGLLEYDPINDSFIQHFYDSDSVDYGNENVIYSMLEDDDGTLWIGTYHNGLYRFDRDKKTFENFSIGSSPDIKLTSNCILALYNDEDGSIYIGTRGGGLCRMDPDRKKIVNLDMGQEDVFYSVYGIIKDKMGYMWLSTSKGIIKYHSKNGHINYFDWSDGALSNYYYSSNLYGSDGFIYFSGASGLTKFNPELININNYKPPILMTGLWVNHEKIDLHSTFNRKPVLNKAIQLTKEIHLEYKENTIELEFALMNYSSSHKNTYAYMIPGFTNGWVNNGSSNRLHLFNLSPGRYDVKISAKNNDGIKTDEIAELSIIIEPPFWGTGWFRMLVYLVFSTFIIGLFQVRLSMVRKKDKRRMEKKNNQLALEYQQRELVLKSMELIKKQEFLETTLAELENLKNGNKELSDQKLKTVIKKLTKLVSFNHVWEEFEKWFSKIHTGFISSLKKDFPDLTTKEVKICAMLRLSLSSKEIASLLHIEVSSIEIYRYRIRKKLGLSKGDNLINFLTKY